MEQIDFLTVFFSRYYVEKIQIMMSRSSNISIPIPDVNGGNRFRPVTKFRYFFCKKESYIWDQGNLLKGIVNCLGAA